MLVSFELSMPGRNSWNGRWSGEEKLFVIVKRLRAKTADKLSFKLGHYSYNFGDGWGAGLSVREVTSSAARKLKKQSAGFCGYDWMVDSIIADGDIYSEMRPKPIKADNVAEGDAV
jgi:hypothetical protein